MQNNIIFVWRFILKTEHLPRQARDKRIGKVEKQRGCSAGMFCCDGLATCEAPLIPDVTESKCMAKAVQEVRAQASAGFPVNLYPYNIFDLSRACLVIVFTFESCMKPALLLKNTPKREKSKNRKILWFHCCFLLSCGGRAGGALRDDNIDTR